MERLRENPHLRSTGDQKPSIHVGQSQSPERAMGRKAAPVVGRRWLAIWGGTSKGIRGKNFDEGEKKDLPQNTLQTSPAV